MKMRFNPGEVSDILRAHVAKTLGVSLEIVDPANFVCTKGWFGGEGNLESADIEVFTDQIAVENGPYRTPEPTPNPFAPAADPKAQSSLSDVFPKQG